MSSCEITQDLISSGISNYFPRDTEINDDFKTTLEECQKVITALVPMEGSHLDNIENLGYFSMDISEIKLFDEDLARKMLVDPLNYFKYLGLAAHMVYKDHKDREAEERSSQTQSFNGGSLGKLWFQCTGHSKITSIGDISPPHYNKFVTITGNVVAVGKIYETIYEAAFRCEICSRLQYALQPMGQLQIPKTCHSLKCSQSTDREKGPRLPNKQFTRLKNFSTKVASQIIIIAQSLYNSKTDEKQVHFIKVQLVNHLIEKVSIMDPITVSGVIVEPKNDESSGICGFYMLASSLSINSQDKFDSKTIKIIEAITSESDILGLLVASFCPSVSCEMVKLGVLLSLIGGHESECLDEEDTVPYKGQIHTLLLGAPSKERKEILDAAHKMAPISTYADKNYTHNLVFDVKFEKGDEMLYAGPVLQANKGVCCIHELDVMKSQWNSLTEIMETEIFQVNKNSFILSVPVELSIVASATPVGGTYRLEKTFYENIKMPSDMLNRFDLIFHLVDEPDHHTDRSFTKRVLQNREGRMASSASSSQASYRDNCSQAPQDRANQPLKTRLATIDKESMDLLPRNLLSRYIQFVRTKIFPKFDEEAHAAVFRFYEEYNEKAFKGVAGLNGYPNDNQLLASLMRLCIARARLEAKQVVTQCDVQDIVELIKFTRTDIFPKDVFTFASQSSQQPFRRPIESSEGLVGLAKKRCRSSNERFVRYLEEYFSEHPENEFTTDELWMIARNGPPVARFEQMIEFLNLHGYILRCGNGRYRWAARH